MKISPYAVMRSHLFRGFFGVLEWRQSYLNIVYLILGFPLGLAYFVAGVTLVALGGGLAVTVLGLPLLAGTLVAATFVLNLDSALANRLLGTRVRRLSARLEGGPRPAWRAFLLRLVHPKGWLSLLYLAVVRFAEGVAGLVVVATLIGAPLSAITRRIPSRATSTV